MESKTPMVNLRIKELADRLRGSMSYDQHYAYLLDWYTNDRCLVSGQMAAASAVQSDHVEALKDVLEALKHLDRKVESVANSANSSAEKPSFRRPRIKVDAKRVGNIFTTLMEKRRPARIME